jgi:hypothetical protein
MSSKRTTYAWLGNKKVHGAWWYDGEIDLGFSGALRSAATVVSDGPLFGLIAYGGDLKRSGGSVEVVPKDGLRTRFYIVRGAMRVQMTLDRDGFAKGQAVSFDDSLRQIAFHPENRGGGPHEASLHLQGMPAGAYRLSVNGTEQPGFTLHTGESREVKLRVEATGETRVTMARR